MLRKIVAVEPFNQSAWIWLSAVADDRREAEAALAQAKKINPGHASLPRAEHWLAERFSTAPPTRYNPVISPPVRPQPAPPPPEPESQPNWFGIINAIAFGVAILIVVLALIILFLGLVFEISSAAAAQASVPTPNAAAQLRRQFEQAQAAQNWDGAIAALTQLKKIETNPAAFALQLAQAYVNKGLVLLNRGFVAEADQQFEQALQVLPGHAQAQREHKLAAAYWRGAEQYQAGHWQPAIEKLGEVWAADAEYINARDLLYSAHYNHALAQQSAGQLAAARQSLQTAISLRPDLSEPRRRLAELEFILAPGTPPKLPPDQAAARQLIVVGIAEQRMLVFDGTKLVFNFVVSTGEPGRDTAVGDFEILDKIDVAYASTWNLDMPFWMGIYWAGSLEDGIHALPIVKHTGYKLWDGYLGQRVSYGCVILSDADAATLYKWAVVGAKVKVVPSLAGWSPENR